MGTARRARPRPPEACSRRAPPASYRRQSCARPHAGAPSHPFDARLVRNSSVWCQPPFEQRALGRIVGQLERPTVGRTRLATTAEVAQQLGPRRVIEVVAVEVLAEWRELPERGIRAGDVPDRDSAVETDDRRVAQLKESVVALKDVRPARLLPRARVVVRERDERLQLVRTRSAPREKAADHADPVIDLVAVPLPALLV